MALDSSQITTNDNWQKLISFTQKLADKLDLTYTRFGLIQYNSVPEVPVLLGRIRDPAILNDTIAKVFYKEGGRRTDLALMKAKEEFAHAAVRPGSSRVLLVVTGGPERELFVAHNTSIPADDLLKSPVEQLNQASVLVLASGVQDGLSAEDKTEMSDQLKTMASEPKADHIFEVPDYDQLISKVDIIANKTCVGMYSLESPIQQKPRCWDWGDGERLADWIQTQSSNWNEDEREAPPVWSAGMADKRFKNQRDDILCIFIKVLVWCLIISVWWLTFLTNISLL